jgi:photosystem II stability/assembly factor-like uncharacterized protein
MKGNYFRSIVLMALVAVCSYTDLFAQAEWESKPSGTTRSLWGVHFVNSSSGWAVGYNGTIIHTTDGGETWSGQTSSLTTHLYGVYFANSSTGWAVGQYNKILKTDNGGQSWYPLTLGVNGGDLWEVQFLDLNTGFIAGSNGVYKTTNGGVSWTTSFSTGMSSAYDVFFKDLQTGWAVGINGLVKRTSDGGASWSSVNTGSSGPFYSVHFTDTKGFIVGQDNKMLISSDGGNTWTPKDLFWVQQQVFFLDNLRGWTCGSAGDIYKTTDGGVTWIESQTEVTNSFNGIHFISENLGWAVGSSGKVMKFKGAPSAMYEPIHRDFRIYPNPCEGRFTIEHLNPTPEIHIEVYSVLGEKVSSNVVNTGRITQVNLPEASRGIYFIKLDAGNKKYSGRIVIQ